MLEWVEMTGHDYEHNEHNCETDDGTFILFSDIHGEKWTLEDPDGEQFNLEATTLQDAKDEAMDNYVEAY